MSVKSIQGKFSIWAGACLVMTCVVVIGFSSVSLRSRQIKTAGAQLNTLAREQAVRAELRIQDMLKITQTLAQTLSAVKDEEVLLDVGRDEINGILRIVLNQNPQVTGVFTCWEPDALDNLDAGFVSSEGHDATGRFMPYWHKGEDGSDRIKPLSEHDPKIFGEYYNQTKTALQAGITAPRPISSAAGGLTASVLVPIMSDGQFYGIVGVELDLGFFQDLVDQVDANGMDSGRLIYVAHNGVILGVTGEPELGGGLFDDSFDRWSGQAAAALTGKELNVAQDGTFASFAPIVIGESDARWFVMSSVSSAQITAQATRLVWIQIGVGGVCVIVALVVLYVIARRIASPINPLVERAEAIAAGDLTGKALPVRTDDELGLLTASINRMSESLSGVVGRVVDSANEVTNASAQIASVSGDILHGANEQGSQITEIASSIEEMSESIVDVARKSAEAAGNADESGRVAKKGGEVVRKTIEGMSAINETVSSSAASVRELGKRVEQIGKIINVINDIADQTNLLALNAAIEAARAGEHGRGFAVVADEVRKLADRTTKSTAEIAGSIKEIQLETKEAVSRMEAGTEQVQVGVGLATDAGRSLDEIVKNAQDVAGMIQSIAAAAEQQSAASEMISRNVESASGVTLKTTEGANHVAHAATDLSAKSEQLHALVNEFKTSA